MASRCMCGAPAVAAAVLDAAATWDGPPPGNGTVRMVVAGAPPPTRTIERLETRAGLGVRPGVRAHRDGADPHHDPAAGGVGRPRRRTERAGKLGRAGAPVLGVEVATTDDGEVLARSNVVMEGYWNQPEATAEAIRDGWFHTGDGGSHRRRALRQHLRPHQGRDHLRRRERQLHRGRGHAVPAPRRGRGGRDRRARREVGRDGDGARGAAARARRATEAELIDFCRQRLAHYKCPTAVELRTELARTATGKLQKFKLRDALLGGPRQAGQLTASAGRRAASARRRIVVRGASGAEGRQRVNAGVLRATAKATATTISPTHTPVGTRAGDGTRSATSTPPTPSRARRPRGATAGSSRTRWPRCPVSTSWTARVMPQPGHHQPVTAWKGHGIVGRRCGPAGVGDGHVAGGATAAAPRRQGGPAARGAPRNPRVLRLSRPGIRCQPGQPCS